MKKLILPLLLLVAFGMLAAVESAPSEVVGYVKYDCYTGYSYAAVPMGAGGNAEDLVAGNMPNITSIFTFNPATQSWSSIDYDTEFEEWTGSLPVDAGDVVLFNAAANTSFFSIGDLPTPYSYSIVPGFNYIVVPVTQGSYATAEDIGNAIGTVTSIYQFDNMTHTWSSIDYDSEFMEWTGTLPINIGDVLLINSTGTASWPVRSASTNPFSLSK